MKYFLRILLVSALAVLLLAGMILPAAAASFDTTVTITESEEQITVVVSNAAENAGILAEKKPTLTVPCSFSAAKVSFGATVVTGPAAVSEGAVTFPVEAPGTYVIEPVEACTVTFHSNGGSEVASQTVLAGSTIPQPTAPTRAGYAFAGWYKEAALTTAWNFETDTATTATTLYAKWTDIKTGTLADTDAGSWNPSADTAILDAAANAQGDADDTVALRLTIKDLTQTAVPKADLDAIDALAIGRALNWLDMKLECSINGGNYTDIGKSNAVLQKITLNFDSTNKKNICVFRYHNGKAEVLSSTATYGERFQLDTTNKKLTIYANKFSTYAIGYTAGNDTLEDYTFTKGHDSKWAKDSTRNLVFVCDGPYTLLDKMVINGQEVSLTSAESHTDGTQVTLKPAFLKTLAKGKYYLELHYKNGGYAIAAFHVTDATGNAATGDQFNMTLWLSLLGISAAAVAVLVIVKKRKL